MTVCVDYFFNHPAELSSLADQINGWIGCSLSSYEENPEDLFSRFLGMELTLSRHILENDRELNFEDFTYQIGIRSPVPDGDLPSIQVPASVRLCFRLLYNSDPRKWKVD